MISIRPSQVPNHLRSGAYYLSLDATTDCEIQVPERTIEWELPICNFEQLTTILTSLQFWGFTTDLPFEVMDFIFYNIDVTYQSPFWDEYSFLPLMPTIRSIIDSDSRMRAAIECGSIFVVKYLLARGHPIIRNACDIAVDFDQADMLELFFNAGCDIDQDMCVRAFAGARINCLKFLRSADFFKLIAHKEVNFSISRGYSDLLRVPDLETLKIALSVGCIATTQTANSAAERGLLQVVRFLAEECGISCDKDTALSAVLSDSLPCLLYILRNGGALTRRLTLHAAQHGALTCLTYLSERMPFFDAEVMEAAARFDHLGCVQYLHSIQCPWDQRTTHAAATYGSLRGLMFASAHGCPVHDNHLLPRTK